tara:strand:- start:79 stop:393 length:315 start_codon:yes stop_codon:yes gene_type:complete
MKGAIMKFILSIVIISLLAAHPQHHHKHHSHLPEFHFGFHINKYHNNYCHICSRIIDSFFINGDKVLVIKTYHPLSKFKRKNLVKKIRKHLGFLSKRVKFRFVI